MKKIETLEDLKKTISKEELDHMAMEYFLELIGKAKKLDEVISIVERKGSLEEIQEIL